MEQDARSMSAADLVLDWPVMGLAALAGFALGWGYFHALHRTIDLVVHGERWRSPLLLTIARIGSAVLVFGGAAQFGAGALLASLAGFLLARFVMLRSLRETA
jgi:hypothetical protein